MSRWTRDFLFVWVKLLQHELIYCFSLANNIPGVGLAVGSVLSLVLFKRRLWPIHYGIGIGFGYALKDLEIDLNAKL